MYLIIIFLDLSFDAFDFAAAPQKPAQALAGQAKAAEKSKGKSKAGQKGKQSFEGKLIN